MPVKPAITGEVAEIGRDGFGVTRIVAPHRNRHRSFAPFVGHHTICGIRDIHVPLVIASDVFANFVEPDKHLCLLARAIKVQQRPSVWKRIIEHQPRAGSTASRALKQCGNVTGTQPTLSEALSPRQISQVLPRLP